MNRKPRSVRTKRLAGGLAILMCSAVTLAAPSSNAAPGTAQATTGDGASARAFVPREVRAIAPVRPIFGRTSEWRRDISSAPTAPNSGALVDNLARQVEDNWGGTAALNVWNYNVSAFVVPPDTQRADVKWDNCQSKSYVPGQLFDKTRGAHFADVPIPAEAVPAVGTDGELSVYDPKTDQLWEFWKANKQPDGWHACWGGRIDDVSKSPGYFKDGMGVTATGLAALGGSINIKEVRRGNIKHAMSLNVITAANWSEFSWPAQRSDGQAPHGTLNAIQEGQRFRLDPTLDVDSLGLHPVAATIARAAQKHGFIVNDKGGAVALVTESGAGTAARTGVNPWSELLRGAPAYSVLKRFPWRELEALPLHHGKPGS